MKIVNFIQIISLFILFPVSFLSAQVYEDEGDILSRLKGDDDFFSDFSVEADSMIEDNYYKHILYNQKNVRTMGYRIRIFSGSGTDAFQQANETRAQFLSKFEDINAYISYMAPDYKVYVGDCRTRSEVLKLFEKIKEDFPYAFIVDNPINVQADN